MTISNLANGHSVPERRPIAPGVFAPLPTFFLPDSQDIDISTYQRHAVKIASAGVGLVISGSMGEAHHLSPSERITLIESAREALDTAEPSLAHVPIIAGTGAGSTRQTIELTRDAYQAGADFAIVICSGFFAGALANDRAALKGFWADVAKSSPLPVIIYNYPGAAGGIDLEADLIEELAAEHSNIVGVKLTCGNVGKLTRIAATTSDPAWIEAHPRTINSPFLVLGGFADFLVPSVFANAAGAITGLANVAPHTIQALSQLAFASLPSAASTHSLDPVQLLSESQRLQGVVAKADRTIAFAGVAGTKWLLQRLEPDAYPVGAEYPRRPLSRTVESDGEKLLSHPNVVALLAEEAKFKKASKASV